jgi:quaternary ammonium compound-resistance protein SugE
MAWLYLTLAGVFEIVWAVGLKYTDGFTKLWPSLITGVAMLVSFGLLSLSLKTLPIGTAYAVWTGIGAAGTAVVGMVWLGDSASLARVACLAMIVGGVVGLKLVTPDKDEKKAAAKVAVPALAAADAGSRLTGGSV